MQTNFSVNFSLKGFTSILIGGYFFISAYILKTILSGFLIDDNPMGMLSAEIIEGLCVSILILVFLFSSFALLFSGKRRAKKEQYALWNKETKVAFGKYMIAVIVIFTTLLILKNQGFINYITPIFLILYGLLLFIFKNKERKNIRILSALCLLLALMCFLIPTYWYSSLCIIGIAHIAYGVAVRQ